VAEPVNAPNGPEWSDSGHKGEVTAGVCASAALPYPRLLHKKSQLARSSAQLAQVEEAIAAAQRRPCSLPRRRKFKHCLLPAWWK